MLEDFQIVKQIGKGNFSTVYKAFRPNDQNKGAFYALKMTETEKGQKVIENEQRSLHLL